MKFSIIVPVYNTAHTLQKCVNSLLEQSYGNLEIILVDDGSTDESSQICDAYAQRDSRIRVIHKMNGGLSDARNAGMRIAGGEYLLFVDSDDYVNTDTCERLLPFTEKHYHIIAGDAEIEGDEKDKFTHIISGEILTGKEYLLRAHAARKAPMAVWLNAYQRSFLQNNGLEFKCGILHEDEEFSPRAFLAAQSLVCTGISFYHYIKRNGSITTRQDQRRNARDLYQTLCSLEQLYNSIKHPILKRYLIDSLSVKYLNLFQVGRLYQYGKEHLHQRFVRKNALFPKTKLKAYLYSLSPRLYYYTNRLAKIIAKWSKLHYLKLPL